MKKVLGGKGMRFTYTKLIIIVTLILPFISSSSYIVEATSSKRVYWNDTVKSIKNEPVWKGDTLWLPIDDIFSVIGAKVGWDKGRKQATVTYKGNKIVLTMNTDRIQLGGKSFKVLEQPQMFGKIAMISEHTLEELTGVDVDHNKKNKKIHLEPSEVLNQATTILKVPLREHAQFEVKIKNKFAHSKQEYSLTIPSKYSNQFKVDKQKLTLLPGAVGQFVIQSKQPLTKSEKKELYVNISSSSQKYSVQLPYEVSNYQLSKHRHPNSFIGEQELSRAKQRIHNVQWAKNYWRYLEGEAQKALKLKVKVPDESAGHSSWYTCKDGSPLTYQNGHFCKKENTYYYGDRYDAGYRFYQHNEAIAALKTLSVAYALSGKEQYGNEAVRIINEYAKKYPNYSLQDRGGRMYWQSLDEAVGMVDILTSYDLLYSFKGLNDTSKKNIELNLIRPSVQTIESSSKGLSNWQAWHIAAIGMAGTVLGDVSFIERAVNGPDGFNHLIQHGVMSDGFWWEGSMAYHTYTLAAFNILGEAVSKWNYDLFSKPSLKQMFNAPISYAYPNLTLPVNNDGGKFGASLINTFSSKGYNDYESAYSRYKDPTYSWLLNQKYKSLYRRGDFALFFGEDVIGNGQSSIKSTNFKDVGHGILRSNALKNEDQLYVLMDYGPHGGSHGHLDKLALDIYGARTNLAPDFGTPAYSHPLYRSWYKQTLSHNTVVVDGESQVESHGKMISFIDEGDFKHMHAEANSAYKGITYNRSIMMDSDYLLDWFHVSDPIKEHQYDWFLHGMGSLSTTVKSKAVKDTPSLLYNQKNGYEQLKNLSAGTTLTGWSGVFKNQTAGMEVYSVPTSNPVQVITSTGPGPSNLMNGQPVIIQRKFSKEADFITIIRPSENGKISQIKGTLQTKNSVTIELENEDHHYYQNYSKANTNSNLLAAKAVTEKNATYRIDSSILFSVNKDQLHVQVLQYNQLKQLSLYLDAKGINSVYLNGSSVDYKSLGDRVMISINK